MGLFDRIFGSSDSVDNSEDESLPNTASAHIENPRESDILLDPELLEGKVNVERRTEIIESHYEEVGAADAQFIAKTLKEYIETYDLQKYEAKNRIEEETGLDRDCVTEIFWTERSSIQKCDDVRSKQDIDLILGFEWRVGGEPCSPVCADVEQITQNSDANLSLAELQELLREKAEEYSNEGGTPERMEHWVPHHKCKAGLQVIVD